MSGDGAEPESELVPFGSWFGPIDAWRFGMFAAIGLVIHLALPYLADGAELRPLVVAGVLAGGALLGIPMGRQDAKGALRPRSGPDAGPAWPGAVIVVLIGTVLYLVVEQVEDAPLYFPLFMTGMGAAGVTGVRTRDRVRDRSAS